MDCVTLQKMDQPGFRAAIRTARTKILRLCFACCFGILSTGCGTTRDSRLAVEPQPRRAPARHKVARSPKPTRKNTSKRSIDDRHASGNKIQLAKHELYELPERTSETETAESINELIAVALQSNPELQKRAHEVDAAWNRVPQVTSLPDPTLGANGFGSPIETAAGGQRANMQFSQRIPWLKRLDAKGQQLAYEALALKQVLRAEQQKVAADVKVVFARLYVLGQQVRIDRQNQELLKSLINVSTQRVGQGLGSQGDVLLGTLELSRFEEDLVKLEQQQGSLQARMNELLNRAADTPVVIPTKLDAALPKATLAQLRQQAHDNQPEIAAAALRSNASAWGLQVASLARMPDVSVNFNWFFIDDNRPQTAIVDIGEDAWSLGASVNLPIWRDKYDAMEYEAGHRYHAAHAANESVTRRYDSLLADLLIRATAAAETLTLFEKTILPQARQTLEADQQSYSLGKVEFDRVIRDLRTLLNLEIGYHRAKGDLAIANAGIEQAIGASSTNSD